MSLTKLSVPGNIALKREIRCLSLGFRVVVVVVGKRRASPRRWQPRSSLMSAWRCFSLFGGYSGLWYMRMGSLIGWVPSNYPNV